MIAVDLINVQAIERAHIDLTENSLIEFTGNNSNGKSIVSKVIEKLTSGEIRNKKTRRTLINDNAEMACVMFTYNEKTLGLCIWEELNKSFLEYIPDITVEDKKVYTRPLSDIEGCEKLMHAFGFRTYCKGNICLQLAPTFGMIPFVTTPGSTNDEIIQDITVDKVADEFISAFSTITYPAFRERLRKMVSDRDSAQTIIDNMEVYDWRAYESLHTRMNECYDAIKNYRSKTIQKLTVPEKPVPLLKPIKVGKLTIPVCYKPSPLLSKLTDSLSQYITALNGKCPTCGSELKKGICCED